jgi:hypothetical protein
MENWDQRRRHSGDERQQARFEDRGRDRDSWWRGERSHDDDRPRRAERGWLDYDRDAGGFEERQGRGEQRYGQERGEHARFSPDWSRDNEQPRYSDEPYYARNRERGGSEQYSRRGRSESSEGGDQRGWEQRSRESIPPEQRELAQRSRRGDYYDPDWPYDRGEQQGRQGREAQRSREDEGSHYRGWYSRSATPFSYAGGTGYLYSESMTLHGPYAGRGPKGYKRSDQQIIEEACQRLERDGEVDATEIEVSAEDGIIRLRGTVPDRSTKRRAEECVESIYGARDVMNELRVAHESGQQSLQSDRGTQASQGTQGSQGAQASQSWHPQQGSQASQGSQTGTGQQGSQPGLGSQGSTAGMRSQSASPTTEQSGEEKRPRH